MTKIPKLALTLERCLTVDWLTYARTIEAGRVGMGQHLALMVGRKEEIELLESPNDTAHEADVSGFDGVDLNPLFVADRAKIIERITTLGHIECWQMRPLLLAAAERRWIPFGKYIVRMSW